MARQTNDQTGLRKLAIVGGKTFAVSVPLNLIKQVGWKKGDTLVVRRAGRSLIIEKREEKTT